MGSAAGASAVPRAKIWVGSPPQPGGKVLLGLGDQGLKHVRIWGRAAGSSGQPQRGQERGKKKGMCPGCSCKDRAPQLS